MTTKDQDFELVKETVGRKFQIKPEPFTMTVWISNEGRLITENDMSKHAQDWQDWRKATAVVTPE